MSASDSSDNQEVSKMTGSFGAQEVPGITQLLNRKTLQKQEVKKEGSPQANSTPASPRRRLSLKEAVHESKLMGGRAGVYFSKVSRGADFAYVSTDHWFGEESDRTLFEGMEWPAHLAEELLKQVQLKGFVNLSPQAALPEKAIQVAFGCKAASRQTWLCIFRVGSETSLDGFMIIRSALSLSYKATEIQKLFSGVELSTLPQAA